MASNNWSIHGNTSSNSSYVYYTEASFEAADYVVLVAFLCVSGVVGIYFSLKGHRNTSDYFYGGYQMGSIPIGISNGVSFLSALSLIGLPNEVFINGSDILLIPLTGSLSYFVGGVLIALILYPLKMTSLNEYFSKRYNSKLLTYIANIIVLVCILEYMGACMLASIVALNSATGGDISIILGLVLSGAVGIFYTSIGGLKAVVWTDVIQFGFMLTGILTIVIKSIIDTPGGMPTIIQINKGYKRIHPLSWSLDPTIRHTFWGMTFGNFIYLIMMPVQPASVQRLCAARTRQHSFIVAAIAGLMYLLFSSLPLWAGFNIFGYYASRGCDIFNAGWVKGNEIVMYYVRERLNYPGFQGFFLAALFSGSLSSFSSGLSAASAILWQDTIKPIMKVDVSDLQATFISKILVIVFGVLSMIWCFVMHSFGGLILQVMQSLEASMYGSYFGLFLFAIFFPNGNYKGAIVGLVTSFTFTLWLGVASLVRGQDMVSNLPSETSRCYTNISADLDSLTAPTPSAIQNSVYDFLLSISYIWMPTVCVTISLMISLMVTGCTNPTPRSKVKKEYLFPLYASKPLCQTNKSSISSDIGDNENNGERQRLSCDVDDSEM